MKVVQSQYFYTCENECFIKAIKFTDLFIRVSNIWHFVKSITAEIDVTPLNDEHCLRLTSLCHWITVPMAQVYTIYYKLYSVMEHKTFFSKIMTVNLTCIFHFVVKHFTDCTVLPNKKSWHLIRTHKLNSVLNNEEKTCSIVLRNFDSRIYLSGLLL